MTSLALLLLFIAADRHGCVRSETSGAMYVCSNGPAANLGCVAVRANESLRVLLPNVRAMECQYRLRDLTDPDATGPWFEGVRLEPSVLRPPTATMLVLIDDGSRLQLIMSREELLPRVAPIDSPEKALALALLLTGYPRAEEFDASAWKWTTRRRPKTYVTKTEDGWIVHNLMSVSSGCVVEPPRPFDFIVLRNGEVKAHRRGPQVLTWK